MRAGRLSVVFMVLVSVFFWGCAKSADPARPLEKVRKEAASMSAGDLETNAKLYASAIRSEKAGIMKIQEQIRKLPMDQVFNNKKMIHDIAATGRRAEALFERYQIYAKAFQEKGGDLSKVQIEPGQSMAGGTQ